MDDLLAEFLAETREMLEAVGGELVAWERDPSDRARLDAIFRFVHTVKGNCGFFDFPRLEKLSHAAEGALAEVRAGRREADAALVDAVLAVTDRISALVDSIDNGTEFSGSDDDALIAALEEGQEAPLSVMSTPANDRPTDGGSDLVGHSVPRSIRLPVDLLDRMMSGVSDMVLARNDLARRLREHGATPTIDGPFERLSSILDDVREGITRMRMQRIEHLFGALPRLVRDLSAELGKLVMIELDGGDVELDREMIEMIRDPLTHIIRNAIDHGIETPHTRLAAGKREIGLLQISARQSGNRIFLTIADDGAGIDGERLLEKSVAAGLVEPVQAGDMSEAERIELIFEPGLSTAEAVSAISGRGVGMDVVRANIERVGGSIEVESGRGTGSRFQLSLPLTLSIIPALTVGASDQLFAIPRSYVEEIVHSGNSSLEFARIGNALLATVRGRRIACVQLSQLLGLPATIEPERSPLVLTNLVGGEMFALAVDRIHDHEELVIKPVAPAIMATGIYAGTTLLDDGSPVMMLDIAGLARQAGLAGEINKRNRRAETRVEEKPEDKSIPVLLFESLNGRRRAIRMEMINRIEKVDASALDIAGGRAQVVIEGRIYPLAGMGSSVPAEGSISLLRLGDGAGEIAYVIARIIDTAAISGEVVRGAPAGEIEGATLIEGRSFEVVDSHFLFANHAPRLHAQTARTCRLTLDDPWSRTVLRPLVEGAGYRVIGSESEEPADIAIAADYSASEALIAARTIRLRATRESGQDDPESIYRYDRAALLAAIAADNKGRAA